MGDGTANLKFARSEIELFLLDELKRAGQSYRRSAEQLRLAAKDAPHRRGSEQSLLMKRASETHTRSLEEYRTALKNFNDLVCKTLVQMISEWPEALSTHRPFRH